MKPSNSKTELEAKLIDLVRERTFLHDIKHPDYKDILMKENAWNTIAENLDTTDKAGKDCMELWITLRNQYTTYLRKLNKPTGSAAGNNPYFRHSKAMQFYRASGESESSMSYSNLGSDALDINSELSNSSHDAVITDSEIPEGSEILGIIQTPTALTRPPARSHTKAMKRSMTSYEENLIGILKDSSQPQLTVKQDEYDLFFSSLANKVRRVASFDQKKASELQFEIHKLVYETEIDLL